MTSPEHYPVAIVGAGPVGLSVANLLGRYGVRCVLLEQNPGTSPHPRAQTIDDESLRTLQAIGCVEKFLPLTRQANGSNYYDEHGERFGSVGPGPSNYGFAKRSYMLQQQLDALLLETVRSQDSVTCRFNTRVTDFDASDDGVNISLTGTGKGGAANQAESLRCDFLIACDGGQSPIRKRLGIRMEGWTYEQDWIVLDALDDPDTDAVSHFICDPARPTVSIASPGNGRRYEFMLLPGEDREAVLSDENLERLLKPYRPWDPAKITRRAVYTFHARIAERLSEGRVFLLGDAAHLTPPFAGQGMNAGIRDAHNIAWKLAAVCQQGVSASVLDSYESERRGPIWAMIQVAVAMGEFVMPVGEEQVALKTSVMKALERFPKAHEWLFQMRFKPKPRYDAGLFVDLNAQAVEASLVGEMLPQPRVLDREGNTRLLDDLLGPGFSLIVFDSEGEAALAELDRLNHPVWAQLSPARLRLNFGNGWAEPTALPVARIPSNDEIADGEDNWLNARPLRTHRGQVLLVRPDRYVAGACFPEEIESFTTELAAALGAKD